MATSTLCLLVLLVAPATATQATNLLTSSAQVAQRRMAHKRLRNSISQLATTAGIHLRSMQLPGQLFGPADVRDLLMQEAQRAQHADFLNQHDADFMKNYARWAPDIMLVGTPFVASDDEAQTRSPVLNLESLVAPIVNLNSNDAFQSRSPIGHSESQETVTKSDGKHTVSKTTHCSDGNCETDLKRGKVGMTDNLLGSVTMGGSGGGDLDDALEATLGNIIPQALAATLGSSLGRHKRQDEQQFDMGGDLADALKKSLGGAQDKPSDLHQAMKSMSHEMGDLGKLFGGKQMKDMMGSIVNAALKPLLVGVTESPDLATIFHHNHADDSNMIEDTLAKALGLDVGRHKKHSKMDEMVQKFGKQYDEDQKTQSEPSLSDMMDASRSTDHVQDSLNAMGRNVFKKATRGMSSSDKMEAKKEWDKGWELGHTVAEKMLGNTFQDKSTRDLGNMISIVPVASSQHDANDADMKDLSNALVSSIFKAGPGQQQDQQGQGAVPISIQVFGLDPYAEAQEAPPRSKLAGSSETRTSETKVENGKRVTTEKTCANGHCKTVVTTEDLLEQADEEQPKSQPATQSNSLADVMTHARAFAEPSQSNNLVAFDTHGLTPHPMKNMMW